MQSVRKSFCVLVEPGNTLPFYIRRRARLKALTSTVYVFASSEAQEKKLEIRQQIDVPSGSFVWLTNAQDVTAHVCINVRETQLFNRTFARVQTLARRLKR